MAAYAALVSVMQILHQIQTHPSPPISLNKQQVESLTEIVTFLQEFLEGYNSPVADGDEADPLEMRIADAAYAAEDLIESEIVDRILSSGSESQRKKLKFFNCFRSPKNDGEMQRNLFLSLFLFCVQEYTLLLPGTFIKQLAGINFILSGEKINSVDFYEGVQKVIEDMDLIKKEVTEMVVVEDQLQRQVSASASLTRLNSISRSSLTRINSNMVGFDDVCLEIMDKLTSEEHCRQVIPIVGMGGIGKTTLAKNIYAQPLIKERFDVCIWATISQQYNTKEILCELLSQANKEGREDEVGLALYKYLYGRRFLIVLDDMWSIEAWEKMERYFPDNSNSSRILVTTRLSNLGSQLDNNYSLEMKFLDEVSSWNMFTKIVFKGESCPLDLEKIGKKIVESCRGLPLSIVVIGGLLEKLERTKKCWESIRRNLNSVVNSENDEHCLKILKMSYNHLPVYLKPCFLYMGVFEEDCAIRVSTVIRLWVSEGFLKPISEESLETTAKGYIKELVDRNLILADNLGSDGSVKYCKIHDLLRDLCLRESQKERFYHVVGHHSPRSTGSKRCIVIPRGSSKKKVLQVIKSTPYARSCISDHERVQMLPNLRLLRTLKAFDVRYYKRHRYSLRKTFELVNLRFLAIGAHRYAKLPSSINLLWSIQTLIVSHSVNNNEFVELVSYPRENYTACVEFWKMIQLRHVQFCGLGLHLPRPPRDNVAIMENLQTLIGVRDFKCDVDVVRRIPNIKKLGITYDREDKRSEPHGDRYYIHNIECLHQLESLSIIYYTYDRYLEKLSFPHSLKKLSLTVMSNYDLDDMLAKIGSLPLLQKLCLYHGSFRTRTWEVVEGQFPSLRFLSLKCLFNLEKWMTESSPFPCLEHLHLVALLDLKEIPTEIGDIPTLQSIELRGCNESAVKSMKKIVEEQEELQGDDLAFKVKVVLWKNEELQNLTNHNFQVTSTFSG